VLRWGESTNTCEVAFGERLEAVAFLGAVATLAHVHVEASGRPDSNVGRGIKTHFLQEACLRSGWALPTKRFEGAG